MKLILGDALEQLKLLESNSIASLLTDPPAGISFMGKSWDGDKGGRDWWIAWFMEVMVEVHRVLKPGAHGFVWALPRTSHWTATALEDAGFEIRDIITHIQANGFPKSLDISKAIDKAAGAERAVISSFGRTGRSGGILGAKTKIVRDITAPATDMAQTWDGWGTALKPSSEQWILVRKPISEKTIAANVLRWETGGINIDANRIGETGGTKRGSQAPYPRIDDDKEDRTNWARTGHTIIRENKGWWPANVVLSDDIDGLSKYFFTPKPSSKEKNAGCEDIPGKANRVNVPRDDKYQYPSHNSHPTVKPLKLMTHLVSLITPPGGIVLDPFLGSGTTLLAAQHLGFAGIGIEQDASYLAIAKARLGVVA